MTRAKKVAVIGDWHLAFVTAAVLADCGHQTTLVKPLNMNSSTWKAFPPIPVLEPGLAEMIELNQEQGRLSFSNGVDSLLQCDFIWLAVDTPVSDRDEPQLEPLLQIAEQIKILPYKSQALIVSSQIPLGFCAELNKITGLNVVYVPENLRLGKGIETFLRADRTVIGSDRQETAEAVKALMGNFTTEFLLCNAVTAEMVKHANNIFLATSISFANELARVGEKFGVDSLTVGRALKLDKRIGAAAYVIPGLGFAGGTLPRDLRVIQKMGKQVAVPTQLVDAVLQVNENTTLAISEIVQDFVGENSSPKTVLMLGYTYKADTDTLRRSLTLDIAEVLRLAGFKILGFDPVMNGKDLSLIDGKITHVAELQHMPEPPAVVLLMTARSIFQELSWASLKSSQSSRQLVLDTQNFLIAKPVLQAGFSFKRLWSTEQQPGAVV